jgi:AAA ATPase-like protein
MAVNAASRIMSRAKGGEILLAEVVRHLAGELPGIAFRDRGRTKLKGFDERYHPYEAAWQAEDPLAFLARTPFVGRAVELARLLKKLDEAHGGRGAMAMLVGEPGIGKSRTCEQFAESARQRAVTVLWGRCYEGEWTPPYNAFGEALSECVRAAKPEELRHALGFGAAPLSWLIPALGQRLPETPEPVPLSADEERFRLFDAVSQFLIAASARSPAVTVLDDLHWTRPRPCKEKATWSRSPRNRKAKLRFGLRGEQSAAGRASSK